MTTEIHWQYIHTLRMCQLRGFRIGLIEHKGWPAIAYVLDGKQYRFRKGVILGTWDIHTGERC